MIAPVATPDNERRLVRCATDMAALSADMAEQLIDANVRIAVGEWRLADATFWQRVKYRARLIRAMTRAGTDPIGTRRA